jgi:dTDP-4-amino-4,6-dideoxygalactose transaminase
MRPSDIAMYFYRVPLAVPYWSGATYRRVFQALRSGSVVEGIDLDDLGSRIVETLGVRDAILCASGSLALELALRWCGVGTGDEVVIPTFCCSAVVPPILAVGAQPVLADVGEELNLTAATVDAALTRRTRAVIVPHLFGNPAEIAAIADLARDKKIRLIDDAAQALGASLHGQPLGSFGDVGILSFGAEKVLFGVGGGAVVSRREDFSQVRARSALQRPGAAAALGVFASTLFWCRWRRFTAPLQILIARKRARDPAAAPRSYHSQGIANLQAAIACSLMETLAENVAARRERADAYRRFLAGTAGVELFPHRPGSACLTQVIRCLPTAGGRDGAAEVITALGRRGYEIQGSYVPIHLLRNFSMCVWDRLPHADRIWTDLVELPCEPGMPLVYVEKIAAVVKATIHR